MRAEPPAIGPEAVMEPARPERVALAVVAAGSAPDEVEADKAATALESDVKRVDLVERHEIRLVGFFNLDLHNRLRLSDWFWFDV